MAYDQIKENRMLTAVLGYCSQTHTLAELSGSCNRKPAKGFCTKCWDEKNLYQVRKVGLVSFKTDDKDQTFCPDCGHTLFWSTTYGIVDAYSFREHASRMGIK
jgi:hypothetical protein